MLAGGACLVRDAQDVLDAMLGAGARRLERRGPPLDPPLREVLEAVELGAQTPDAVASGVGLPGGEAAAALADLESQGYVACSLLGVYTRTTLEAPSDI